MNSPKIVDSYYFASATGALKGVEDRYGGKIITFNGPFDQFTIKDRILHKGSLKLLLREEDMETSPFLETRTKQILSKLSKQDHDKTS